MTRVRGVSRLDTDDDVSFDMLSFQTNIFKSLPGKQTVKIAHRMFEFVPRIVSLLPTSSLVL